MIRYLFIFLVLPVCKYSVLIQANALTGHGGRTPDLDGDEDDGKHLLCQTYRHADDC